MSISLLQLDPGTLPDLPKEFRWQHYFTEDLLQWLIEKGMLLLLGLVLLFLGFKLTGFLVRFLKRLMRKAHFDDSLISFLGSLSGFVIKVLVIVMVAAMMGIETSAFVALIGAAGLAVGLALQGSLSNFAGGVLILIFKPFQVDDIIIHSDQEGVVKHIDILYTQIRKYDNELVIAPNGALANELLINLSRMPLRRVEIPVRISYSSDIKRARELVLAIFQADGRVVDDPPPQFLMMNMEDHYLSFSARGWSTMDDYWVVYWECLEAIKEAFHDEPEVEMPFPRRQIDFTIPREEAPSSSSDRS